MFPLHQIARQANKQANRNMRRQTNKMPPKTTDFPKGNLWDIEREETKSCTPKLFEVSREITKQINKEFGKYTGNISNKILDQINKMITESTKNTNEKLDEKKQNDVKHEWSA